MKFPQSPQAESWDNTFQLFSGYCFQALSLAAVLFIRWAGVVTTGEVTANEVRLTLVPAIPTEMGITKTMKDHVAANYVCYDCVRTF